MKIDLLSKEIECRCKNCDARFFIHGEWDTENKYICHCGYEQIPFMSDKYPDGKLNDGDQGAVAIALVVNKGHLIIDFGTSITWFGFDRQTAIKFGEKIVEIARTIDTH